MCQRAENIIGLYAVYHQDIPAEGGNGFMQGFDLCSQLRRHRGAMGFVFGVPVVAECFSLGIKYTSAIIRGVISTQAAQHIEHALYGSGRFAGGAA